MLPLIQKYVSQEKISLIILLKQLNALLTSTHRKRLALLSILVLLSGIAEIVGIASIMPFMGMVVSPDVVVHNHYLSFLYHYFSFSSTTTFLRFIGVIVLSIMLVSNLISALTIWGVLQFSFSLGKDLSNKMFSSYLNHSYVFFLNRNSSELVQNILWEIGRIVNGILIPLLTIYSKIVVAASILGLLVWMNPQLALVAGLVLGGAYSLVFFLVRKSLSKSGNEVSVENAKRTQIAYETLGGIKDIKLLGRERDFYDRFQKPIELYALYQSRSQMISLLPRYALETLAYGGIIVIVIYLLAVQKSASHTLPMMALYALAGYRIMPALQQIFANLASVRFNISAVERITKDLKTLSPQKDGDPPVPSPETTPLPFTGSISLENIVFRYTDRPEPVLKGVSLSIKANTTIGIVGSTGSGKTTTLDILLGLLEPESGRLIIDGIPISKENVRSWQANIGYVPQQIMLMDDTIERNIAFGIPDDKVDREKVVKAAKLAHLHDFIEKELEKGYGTEIGEKGVRLSGGQRQRIGIARALYHEPSVLVLDEATSALDNITENVIMEALHTLSRQKTILMVAHRLTTVRECDWIFVMENGHLSDQGTYQELLSRNTIFQQLAPKS
jgi:ABC-type multidrug transport system fused ATPase/permease subunit